MQEGMLERAKVITLQTTTNELQHLKKMIEDKIHHTYLKKYIQKPVIDENKLLILYTILMNTSLSSHKKEKYILTTMLVQIALDTHELVPDQTREKSEFIRPIQGQLNVLAGDYYSGLYYSILSEINDVGMIKTLATAIKEINERKMKLHYVEAQSVDDWFTNLKLIESLLVTEVAEYIEQPGLNVFAQEWMLINRINQELGKLETENSLLNKLMDTKMNHSIDLSQSDLEKALKMQIEKVKDLLAKIPESYTGLKVYIRNTLKSDT
ncbi:heptaprenyl diphosphate synthase [Oceanobacillus limi]|uniref:Heptaprenyl diphosphate synthase n=1 Tax=Oceanobacillus limi TaxID=930131 RepID=A0A1H9ZGB4_9BACI|nr:heptaprenyl diphosphate synthase component 1 [Oceanobacillus limi]SES80640.1 heptaprenyl diphosphate synthase [Oceanobacillus limi]